MDKDPISVCLGTPEGVDKYVPSFVFINNSDGTTETIETDYLSALTLKKVIEIEKRLDSHIAYFQEIQQAHNLL